MRLAGEPDVSLDLHDRWLRGQNLHREIRSGKLAAGGRHLSRRHPRKSDFLAVLQQPRADEQHRAFRAPGRVSRSRQGEGDPRTGEDRRSTRSGRFQGASVLWLVLCDGASREAEAAPHMELACELNDNDPWTLAVLRALLRFLRIDRAGSSCAPAVACAFAGALRPRMGLPRHHSLLVRRLCGRARGHATARMASSRPCPHGARPRCSNWEQPEPAREEAQRFLNGIRSFWVGSGRADRRGGHTLASAGSPHQHQCAVGNPARTAWVAQGFRSRASLSCSGELVSQAQMLIV